MILKTRMQIFSTGSATFSALFVLQMLSLSLSELDMPLTIALLCFAITLPLSLTHVLIVFFHSDYDRHPIGNAWYLLPFWVIYAFAMLIGAVAVFWHFNPWIGIVFFFSTVVSAFGFGAWDARIKTLNKEDRENLD